jgi:hypothetical protein
MWLAAAAFVALIGAIILPMVIEALLATWQALQRETARLVSGH